MDFIVHFLLDWGYIALFICMALENMNIPIPSEIILGFAGFLVSQHIFDFTTATIVATIAGLVGSLLSYYMGLKGGRNLMLRHTAKGGLGAKKLSLAKNWFEKYGGLAVFTGRLLPGIRTFISLPAGIAKYPLKKFIIYTLLGTIPWTIFLIYMGDFLGENWTLLIDYKLEIGVTCCVLAAIAGALFYIFHKQNKIK
ncbi:DedA family protein [uncultured Megasphaera sp.]|uniref:DedA family protein n=1 Tax=uncultured Megasphaera sp. TaxID=165188 RepID=UPI0025992FC4|nr:DedA family protein [uncultured Megasphaera sp.]